MPVFNDDGVSYHYVDYTVVSVVAHLGRDQAGHCRSALRFAPVQDLDGFTGSWKLTDDFQTPQDTVHLPPLIQQNTVVIGLVRSDCHVLHESHAEARELHLEQMIETPPTLPETGNAADPTQAILHICQTMTEHGNLP